MREWNEEIIFLHKILPGAADKSYGIQVARLAGLPKPVVERAKSILSHLELHSVKPEAKKQGPKAKNTAAGQMPEPNPPQMDLFDSTLRHPRLPWRRTLDGGRDPWEEESGDPERASRRAMAGDRKGGRRR